MIEGALTGLIFISCAFLGSMTTSIAYYLISKSIAYKKFMQAETELMQERAKNERIKRE